MYAKSGDVFCVYNTYLKKYTACQVTKIENDEKHPKAVLLSLDWFSDDLLTEEQLPALTPLYQDFMYWKRGLHLVNVDLQIPLNYTLIGNIAPLSKESTNSYASWGSGYQVYRQLQWQQIPQQQRDVFKQADESKERVLLAGQEVLVNSHRLSDDSLPFEDAAELAVLPCLSSLSCTSWHSGLYDYLQACPFLTDLALRNHGQSKLDFQGTHLRKLIIQMDGVKELHLNDELEELMLLGSFMDVCKISAFEEGSDLLLTTSKAIPIIPGLRGLGNLHCTGVTELDLAEISLAYPKLRELRLWGKPGTILHFSTLSRFTMLESFSTVDLFGFSEADIPKPALLPKLNRFWMSSLPEDAAKAAKRLYKKQKEQGLDLWIQKARKSEWLAQNLENPFRSWDGQKNISPANAKKAADLYKKTRSAVLALLQDPVEDAPKLAESFIQVYTEGFNKMDKRTGFIETVEREDIYRALLDIVELIPPSANIQKEGLLAIFDAVRDF